MRFASSLLLAAALPSVALAQNALKPVLSVETLKTVTQTLSSDAYEGRAPATPAEAKTVAYIVERFKQAGLKPGNPKATGEAAWYQDVPLVELTAGDVTPLTFTGGATPVTATYRTGVVIGTYRVVPKVAVKDSEVVFVGYGINAPERGWNDYAGVDVPLVELTAGNVTPLTFTGGATPVTAAYRTGVVIGTYRVVPKVAVKDSDVVFVGYGINAPERGWNDYAGVDVKGRTVVILINDPDWRTPDLKGDFGGRAMTYYGRWTYKFEEAARQGAAAAIIVHDTEPAAYGWGVVQSSWTGPQLEQDMPGNHMDQSQAIGWIQKPVAEALFRSAGKDFSALSTAAASKGFKAVPLGVKASVSFSNQIRRQASKNVVGILPGTSAPQDVVLYSAHWDHLGRCDAVNGDDICNGAVDNASGTAGLVAIAEAAVKAGPAKRSQVFLAVTGEESGLLGSDYYARNPLYPLARTVGGVNMDGLNVVGKAKDFVLVGAGKSELEDLVKPLVAAEGRVIGLEPTPEKGYYYRSDHFSLAKLGVPMLYGESGDDLVVGGTAAGRAAADDYTVNRYHKPQDEYDPKWKWDGALSDLTIYYGLGRALADGDTWPSWYAGSEFRAIREQSRAGVK